MIRNSVQERWKSINGFPDYEISSLGRVRCLVERKFSKHPFPAGSLVKAVLSPNGYFRVLLRNTKMEQKNKSVHRLVAEAFIPNPEEKPQVNHKNGIKTDNSAENLEWVTAQENKIHAVKNGLQNFRKGDDAYNAKHSAVLIQEMLSLHYDSFISFREISEIYKISEGYVVLLLKGLRRSEEFDKFINKDTKYQIILDLISNQKRRNISKVKEQYEKLASGSIGNAQERLEWQKNCKNSDEV